MITQTRQFMPTWSLGSKQISITSSMTCNHRPWVAHMARTMSRVVRHHLFWTTFWSIDVRCGRPSSPLDKMQSRMTSGLACHHWHKVAHAVEQRRAWHAIITIGYKMRLYDIRFDMGSLPLDYTNGGTTSCVACHHCPWRKYIVKLHRALHAIMPLRKHTYSDDVENGMLSSPLDNTHDRTMSGVKML